jgi:membrane protease YdiL (CAAX protease family)
MNENTKNKVMIGVLLSFVLWYFVFLSDILFSFWYRVSFASIVLAIYVYVFGALTPGMPNLVEALKGILSGFLLYVLFFFGFNVFKPFVVGGAENVYVFRSELPLIIPSVLLLITSFCEEYFWRKFTQRKIVEMYGIKGILITSVLYSSIHLVTFNLPLITAAFIAGTAWGFLYWYTDSFWIVVFSHVIWTELIFVILPLR